MFMEMIFIKKLVTSIQNSNGFIKDSKDKQKEEQSIDSIEKLIASIDLSLKEC